MRVLFPFLRTACVMRSMQLSATEHPYAETPDRGTLATRTTTELARQLPALAEGSRRVVLVRHAATDWNARGLMQGGGFDVELDDEGRRQARVVADELRNALPRVDVVASSHLARASETADAVSEAFRSDRPVRIINHKFGEMRFGVLEGSAVRGPECTDDTRHRFQTFDGIMHENKDVPWPGASGESIRQVEERAQAGLSQILRGFPDCDHFCVVSHGRLNKVLLMSLLGLTGKDPIQQGNTGINVIDIDSKGRWKARAINYLQHAQRPKANFE